MSGTPELGRASTGPPLATPSYGPGGSFTISCSSRIRATPRECLDVVLDSSGYPEWNRFCRKCTIDSHPPETNTNATTSSSGDDRTLRLGTQFTFDVHLNTDEPAHKPGQAIALEVSVLEAIDEPVGGDEEGEGEGAGGGDGTSRRRKGWRVAWRQRQTSWLSPGWMLRSERVQEFVEVPSSSSSSAASPGGGDAGGTGGGVETEYRCWETFYGLLAPVVRLAVGGQVEKGFDAWEEGLRGRAEERAKVDG